MEKAIEIKDLSKHYWLFNKDYKTIPWLFTKRGHSGVKKALDNINITVGHGETVGIIGKNGAGKSTLMKLVAGITFPTEGEIKINGTVGSLINLGAGFFPEYTGRENIYYKGTITGMKEEDIDRILDDIIKFADVGDYFDLPIKTYSSGMAARLGFALAIFSNPDILIIDEVFAVGDKDFRKKSFKKTQEMFESGKSILFSSHSDAQIRQFCSRVIYIDEGEIVYDGDVEEGLRLYNSK